MASVEIDSIRIEDPVISEMLHSCRMMKSSSRSDDFTHYAADDDSEKDSGSWSLSNLPGADLSMDEFNEEFMTPVTSCTAATAQPLPLQTTAVSLDNLSYIPEGSLISLTPSILLEQMDLPGTMYSSIPDFAEIMASQAVESLAPAISHSKKKSKQRRGKKLDESRECLVCTKTITDTADLVTLECCKNAVCAECMDSIIKVRVTDGQTYIPCPIPNCTKALKRDFIVRHIKELETLNKYERFRLNVEPGDNSKKTCPNCCLITESDLPHFNPRKKNTQTPNDYMITCSECTFNWCFNCHSPWHEGLSCASYRKGDKQFLKWTKGRKKGFTPNCQQCPKCRVYIERSTGCDSMHCNQCQTYFCYKCGGKFHGFPGLGDHYNSLSVLGCRYRYLPEQTAKRRLIRGGYLFAKCAAAAGFPILLVGGVAVVGVGAVVLVPIIGGVVAVALIRKKIRGH